MILNNIIFKQSIWIALCFIFFTACSKDEGKGGTSSIIGKIHKQEIGPGNIVLREYDAPEERIYITYGDNYSYDDDIRSSFDGTFKFENLQKGNYTIFAYTECLSCPAGIEAVIKEVEIDKKNEIIDIGTIDIVKY